MRRCVLIVLAYYHVDINTLSVAPCPSVCPCMVMLTMQAAQVM